MTQGKKTSRQHAKETPAQVAQKEAKRCGLIITMREHGKTGQVLLRATELGTSNVVIDDHLCFPKECPAKIKTAGEALKGCHGKYDLPNRSQGPVKHSKRLALHK